MVWFEGSPSKYPQIDTINPPGQASHITSYKGGIAELDQDETFQFSISQLCHGQCFLPTVPPLVRIKPSCSWTAFGLNLLGLSRAGPISLTSLLALIFFPKAGKSPPTPLPQEGLKEQALLWSSAPAELVAAWLRLSELPCDTSHSPTGCWHQGTCWMSKGFKCWADAVKAKVQKVGVVFGSHFLSWTQLLVMPVKAIFEVRT